MSPMPSERYGTARSISPGAAETYAAARGKHPESPERYGAPRLVYPAAPERDSPARYHSAANPQRDPTAPNKHAPKLETSFSRRFALASRATTSSRRVLSNRTARSAQAGEVHIPL